MLGKGSQNPYLEVKNRISNILTIKKHYTLLLCECKAYMQNGLNASDNCYQTIESLLKILDEYDRDTKNKDNHTENKNKDDNSTYSINLGRIQLFGHIVRMYNVLEHQILLIKIIKFWNLIAKEAEVWQSIEQRIVTVKFVYQVGSGQKLSPPRTESPRFV